MLLGRSLAGTATLLMVVTACAPGTGTRLDTRPHGSLVSVPPRPSEADCEALIRGDHGVSASIRVALGVDGVDASIEASTRAATDPAADYEMLGIPLTPQEVDQIRSSLGVPDATVGLVGLVAARPDAMGTFWLDDRTPVVSVLSADTGTLRIARCLERRELVEHLRYVTAGVRPADLVALADLINSERSTLARDGIDVSVVEADPTTETVTVGVGTHTPEIEARLVERYGSVVRVVQKSGPRPAWPP